jgi:microcystin-dependent protein
MSQPFIGQLMLVGFNFAPQGWAFCNGQLMAISQNDALFNLIGTTYGGDGQSTFAVPDLQGRAALHQGTAATGTTYLLGQTGGVETVTLSANQMPQHTHAFTAAGVLGDSQHANNTLLADGQAIYTANLPNAAMLGTSVSTVGGNQPHDNLQPFLVLNWIIALEGVYPAQ